MIAPHEDSTACLYTWHRMIERDVRSVVAPEPIAEFNAYVARVQTMADGSPRVTLDMSEDRVDLLTTLARTRTEGEMLTVLVFNADKWKSYLETVKSKL